MLTLSQLHPARLVVGAAVIGERIATAARQSTLAILCRDIAAWARQSRDVIAEIATDADTLEAAILEAAADGQITPQERDRLRGYATEIRDQAVTGQILSRPA